jgi:hypothetical protein
MRSSWQFRRLDSILFLLLFSTPTTDSFGIRLSYNNFHGPNGKHSLYCWRSVFTVPLLSNRLPIVTRLRRKVFIVPLSSNGLHIVACTFFAGMRLPNRCLTVGIHVKICYAWPQTCRLLWTRWELYGLDQDAGNSSDTWSTISFSR